MQYGHMNAKLKDNKNTILRGEADVNIYEFNRIKNYFKAKIFKDKYNVGEKVYYLDEKNNYKFGKIKTIERDDTNKNDLYLISGCEYLRSKEHIYCLYI